MISTSVTFCVCKVTHADRGRQRHLLRSLFVVEGPPRPYLVQSWLIASSRRNNLRAHILFPISKLLCQSGIIGFYRQESRARWEGRMLWLKTARDLYLTCRKWNGGKLSIKFFFMKRGNLFSVVFWPVWLGIWMPLDQGVSTIRAEDLAFAIAHAPLMSTNRSIADKVVHWVIYSARELVNSEGVLLPSSSQN